MDHCKIEVCGKTYDVAEAFPLLARDTLTLEDRGLMGRGGDIGPFHRMAGVVTYFLKKIDPELDADKAVDGMQYADMNRAWEFINDMIVKANNATAESTGRGNPT